MLSSSLAISAPSTGARTRYPPEPRTRDRCLLCRPGCTRGPFRARASRRSSRITIQLTLLDHPLMRLVRALDAVLMVVTFRRQQLGDLVDAARPAAAVGAGGEEDALADLEFMIAQVILHDA